MTTLPTLTTRTMHPNSPRPILGNRDPRNHTLPLPTMCRTTHLNLTTIPLTVQPLMPFHIRHRLSGTAKVGPSSVSPWHHRHPSQRHPSHLHLVDLNPPPHPHLHLHPQLHPPPPHHLRPLPSVDMLLHPHSHNLPILRCDEPRERLKVQTHPLKPSANRGRKKLPPLGIPHLWHRPPWRQQLRWILISGRHALSPSSPRDDVNDYMRLFGVHGTPSSW